MAQSLSAHYPAPTTESQSRRAHRYEDPPPQGAATIEVDFGASLAGIDVSIVALTSDVGALSNCLVGLERDVGSLSNTLAYEYITINNLNTQLVAIYIQQYEKANFAVSNINVSGALTVKGAPMSFNDLKNLSAIVLPVYLPPIYMTTNQRIVSVQVIGNGVYLYESSIPPDNVLFRLTGFTNVIRYASLAQWPIVITLSIPAPSALTKYAMRAGLSSMSPSA
jgi:hypothetical protein